MKELKQEIIVNSEDQLYTLQMVKPCRWCWLLLLLLLPFVLLIPVPNTIDIRLADRYTDSTISRTDVYFKYVKRDLFSFEKNTFFTRSYVTSPPMKANTSEKGIAGFKTKFQLYQLFSFFNHPGDTARAFIEGSECFTADSTYKYFRLSRKSYGNLYYSERNKSIKLIVVDEDDNNEPLPHAKVYISYKINGQTKEKSAITDYRGEVKFSNIPVCINYLAIGSKYGWYNDTIQRYVNNQRKNPDTLYLKRKHLVLKFYVKDLLSDKALVGAHGKLYYKREPNQQVGMDAVTNYKGIGKGVFADVHQVADIKIDVNTNSELSDYADTSSLEVFDKWLNVENWKNLKDEAKVLHLRKKITALPCNESVESGDGTLKPKTFYMGMNSGYFELSYKMHGHPDIITIYEGSGTGGKVLFEETITDEEGSPQELFYDANNCNGYLTVKIWPTKDDQSSRWRFRITCPE